jgi:hypothetical protein
VAGLGRGKAYNLQAKRESRSNSKNLRSFIELHVTHQFSRSFLTADR